MPADSSAVTTPSRNRDKADPHELWLVEAALGLVNAPAVEPDRWMRAGEEMALRHPNGEPIFQPWDAPLNSKVASLTAKREVMAEQLRAMADDLDAARASLAPKVNAELEKIPLLATLRVQPSGAGITQFHPSSLDSFVAVAWWLLLDPARMFGAALTCCDFVDPRAQPGTPTCGRWFLSLSTGSGGDFPKYCDRRDQHRDAMDAARSPKRQQKYRLMLRARALVPLPKRSEFDKVKKRKDWPALLALIPDAAGRHGIRAELLHFLTDPERAAVEASEPAQSSSSSESGASPDNTKRRP